MVLEVAQAFPLFGGLETHEQPQQPESAQYAPEVPHYATNGGGNGAGHEMAMVETEMRVETIEEDYEQMAARPEEVGSDRAENEIEAEAPKSSIAQRFAARRERRRSRKTTGGGGGSLRDRLRGLVAESPET